MKVTFWIITLILFPITAGLYFIWPSKIYGDRISRNWKIFWWVIYAVLAFWGVASKVFICLTCFLMTYKDSGPIANDYYSVTDEEIVGDSMVYHYEIYPDEQPVDRSRGMCDRMVEGLDGKMTTDAVNDLT